MIWRALAIASITAAQLSAQLSAQAVPRMAREAHPAFEVAAIRLSDPAVHRQGINADGHRMTLHGQTVTSMMMFAYGAHPSQIVDGPAWRSEDKYDIDGVVDTQGEPNLEQMQEIVQKMLVSRFGLKLRRERREMGYYAIVVSKGGAKLTKSAHPEEQPENSGKGNAGGLEMKFTSFTVAHFGIAMQYFIDRPLVDETGLVDVYDFTLTWTQADASAGDGSGPPALFTAIQEQLGLKLEPKKGPVEAWVIEGLERPSAN